MTRYRSSLPQLTPQLFLTDGGIATTLVHHEGFTLPASAVFPLVQREDGRAALLRYYRGYAEIARRHGTGLILESATWRASIAWGRKLGYGAAQLVDVNRQAVALLEEIRAEYATPAMPVIISGCVGPRSEGYESTERMRAEDAERYHRPQVATFASTVADLVTAMTMHYAEEAIGIANAARAVGMPVAIAFTVETDGQLPSGQALADAIAQVDAATEAYPRYYVIDCAHPTHFAHLLRDGHPAWQRLRGLRAHASRGSHADLHAMTALDAGNPDEFALWYDRLREELPWLTILGGCCGTDHRHIAAVAERTATLR